MAQKSNEQQGVKTGVNAIGKIAFDTIKQITDPVLKAIVAILSVVDILGLIIIVYILTQSVAYGTYSFGALLICNFVILIILALKKQNTEAMVRSEKKETDSNYPKQHE